MDAQLVRDRVEEIRVKGVVDGDDEVAHSMEDELYLDVLKMVARGVVTTATAIECAAEALKAQDLDFARWCA